jgi:S-DNA-T family DNA segregation ATPase FtsK/SpoIIIE
MPAMMRRVMDPVPELVEQTPPHLHDYDDLPSDDRIRARISDVVRARVRNPQPAALAGLGPRREPEVIRPRGQSALGALPRTLGANTVPLPRIEPAVFVSQRRAPTEMSAMISATKNAFANLGDDALYGDPEGDDRFDHTDLRQTDHSALALDDIDHDLDADVLDHDWDNDNLNASAHPEHSDARNNLPLLDRRAVVQPPVKKTLTPSRKAQAEAQPRLRFGDEPSSYELPPLSLLASPDGVTRYTLSHDALEENARMLESVLDDYGVKGEIVSVRPGPVVTMYELEPAPGLKASRVIGLADDIARSMSALSARVSTVPGRTVIGIELPNASREKVVLREIISARDFGDSAMRLPLALGKDIGGEPVVANLAKMPHLLIAGTTGSGKSVAINTMILSLLYKLSPDECRLIMIDPKMLELSVYDGIPHLLSPVVTDPKKAVVALKWVVGEMEERYRKMSKMGVRNIEGFNGRVREALAKNEMFKRTIQTGFDEDSGEPVFETEEFQPVTIPYIVVVVDEMADLMMVAGKEIEACIQRLAQMARASGIHLIMATQRPSVDVITGTIKANFPTRISFQVTSKIDSRTILGEQGAEQLLGMGDMLYMAGGGRVTRIHGPFVSDEEVEEIVNHLKSYGPPTYMSGVVDGPEDDTASEIDAVLGLGSGDTADDALYDQAVAIVAKDRKCSTSYIQRKLGIGYNKAARLVEQMEENHVVTSANHVGKREILLPEH